MFSFITALLFLQQSDSNAEIHNLTKILSDREKNIATTKRRHQVIRDRKFLERYNPDDPDKPFDAKKYNRFLDIQDKYSSEKNSLLEFFNNTKNINEHTPYPDEISPDDFLTLQDFHEVNLARINFTISLFEFQRKKNRRSFFRRVFSFLAVLAFIVFATYAGAK